MTCSWKRPLVTALCALTISSLPLVSLSAQRTPIDTPALDSLVPPVPSQFIADEAGVLSSTDRDRIAERLLAFQRTWGVDIGIAILPSLNGRDAVEAGVQIIRRWKVGSTAPIGDPRHDVGALILLVPKETNTTGRGVCRIATTTGAEAVLTDATAGSLCRGQTASWKARDYATGLLGLLPGVEAALSTDLTPLVATDTEADGAPSMTVAVPPATVVATPERDPLDGHGVPLFFSLLIGGAAMGMYLSARNRRLEREVEAQQAREKAAQAARLQTFVAQAQARQTQTVSPRPFTGPAPAPPTRRRADTPVSSPVITPLVDDSWSRRSVGYDTTPSYDSPSSPSYNSPSSDSGSFGDSGSTSGGGGGSDW